MSQFKFRPLFSLVIFQLLVGCLPNQDRTPFPIDNPIPEVEDQTSESPTLTSEPPGTAAPFPTVTPADPTGTQAPIEPTATKIPEPTEPPYTTILFTGQIVPGRCVQAEVDRIGSAEYIFADIAEILTAPDLTVGTLNAALSDFPPSTGCVDTFVLVGGSIHADAMAAAGFDVMSAATNHIKNCGFTSCGDRAFFDTLENLERVGIQSVGAGANLQEASKPLILTVNGVNFAFLSLGQIEPLAFAGPDTPGIGVLSVEALQAGIAAAKEIADVVIFLPHWGPEYSHAPNPSQLALAAAAVDAGADLIVGNHTHYIQAYGNMGGVPVFFGLGNFVFDQTQERARQQSILVRVLFQGKDLLSYEILPVTVDRNGKVQAADELEAMEILNNLTQYNDRIP